MNYLAHGFRWIDRPWYLAGTAVPDWLAVADRRVRLRADDLKRWTGESTPQAELAAGVRHHLEDDRRFHQNPAFIQISRVITSLAREFVGRRKGDRLSFFGHVATELLLDSWLIEEDPRRLDDYYASLAQVDAGQVEEIVNEMAPVSTARLAPFVRRFRSIEFLRDYCDDERLLFRLNQVMRRIGLKEVPRVAERALAVGRSQVRDRAGELLAG